jgi:hypothetical protein
VNTADATLAELYEPQRSLDPKTAGWVAEYWLMAEKACRDVVEAVARWQKPSEMSDCLLRILIERYSDRDDWLTLPGGRPLDKPDVEALRAEPGAAPAAVRPGPRRAFDRRNTRKESEMSMSPVPPEEARLKIVGEGAGAVLYCEIKQGGRFKRIAKRYPGKNWISLEPGYTVRGGEPGGDRDSLTVEYKSAGASVQ